jgi:hypothetical protein
METKTGLQGSVFARSYAAVYLELNLSSADGLCCYTPAAGVMLMRPVQVEA